MKVNTPEPLLLEGHALQSGTGRIALCIGSYLVPDYNPEMSPGRRRVLQAYEYEMFDEGDVYKVGNAEVLEVIASGGRVVITEI